MISGVISGASLNFELPDRHQRHLGNTQGQPLRSGGCNLVVRYCRRSALPQRSGDWRNPQRRRTCPGSGSAKGDRSRAMAWQNHQYLRGPRSARKHRCGRGMGADDRNPAGSCDRCSSGGDSESQWAHVGNPERGGCRGPGGRSAEPIQARLICRHAPSSRSFDKQRCQLKIRAATFNNGWLKRLCDDCFSDLGADDFMDVRRFHLDTGQSGGRWDYSDWKHVCRRAKAETGLDGDNCQIVAAHFDVGLITLLVARRSLPPKA